MVVEEVGLGLLAEAGLRLSSLGYESQSGSSIAGAAD